MYIEKCNNNCMISHPFFIDKIKQIQHLLVEQNGYYILGNISWPINIVNIIETQNKYPSEYFIKVISNIQIINKNVVNPPIVIPLNKKANYIQLHHNKLLIIDALLNQGSRQQYISSSNMLYSEHAGVISIKDNIIDSINISTNTTRIDPNDNNIFLPIHDKICYNYEYIFHTHPNNGNYAGRLHENIIYEFPSANDIMYYIQCHNNGITQGSIIVAPEGIYIIRQLEFQQKISITNNFYSNLIKLLLELEKKAIKKYKFILEKLSDPDIFHEYISNDFYFINKINDFLSGSNVYVEFYPREKKNNEWYLPSICLVIVN